MAEALVSDDDVILTKADIVSMTVDELRRELKQRGRLYSGMNKTELQVALIQTISQKAATTACTGLQADATALSTVQLSPPLDREQLEIPHQLDEVTGMSAVQRSLLADQDPSLDLGARPKIRTEGRRQPEATDAVSRDEKPSFEAVTRTTTRVADVSMESTDLQLQLRRLEMEERAEIR